MSEKPKAPYAKVYAKKNTRIEGAIALSLNMTQLAEQAKEFGRASKNGDIMLNIDLFVKKETDQFGNDFDAKVNTWVPTTK